MKSFILGMICIISPFISFGHNPLSAKYHLEAGEKVSLLTINLSQDGVNQAMLKNYSEQQLAAMTENSFKELIVNYIKSNFNMTFDNQKIPLGQGGVKLGNHQTDLKFVLPATPHNIEKINIEITAFEENGNHQTIFSYKTKMTSGYEILSTKNNFKSTISVSNKKTSNSLFWIFALTFVILLTSLLIKYRYNNFLYRQKLIY